MREARWDDVHQQFTPQTCYRYLQLDHEYFMAICDLAAWAPMRHSFLELPTALLLALLYAGLPPNHLDTPCTYLNRLNTHPLMTRDSLTQHCLGKRTLAVSSDNSTQSLLFRAGGGVQVGVHHTLLKTEAGTPTVVRETVRYGIF